MVNTEIRIATRGSALARAQAGLVAEQLERSLGRPVVLVPVAVAGDDTSRSIESLGATGVFVAAVRRAVLDGQAQIAVHSMKDLPTAAEPGLRIAAVPRREDPRDALCGAALPELEPGARIGTGSPRRAAQLRHLRRDLRVVGIRGNVDTRLGLVERGELDAVVLAVAGLRRLGRSDAVAQVLPVGACTPAPAQGALAVECREDLDDRALLEGLEQLDDPESRATTAAERSLLAALAAGCTAPVGAHAVVTNHNLALTGAVADRNGGTVVRMSNTGSLAAPEQLGAGLAARLLAEGAADLMGDGSHDH